jgi:hypothetical protein
MSELNNLYSFWGPLHFRMVGKMPRLWKNYEHKLNPSLQFVHLAFPALLIQKL